MEGGGSFPKGDVSSEAQRLGQSCSGVGQCRCKGPGAGETCLEGGEEVNALAPAGPGAVACWKGLGFRSCCSGHHRPLLSQKWEKCLRLLKPFKSISLEREKEEGEKMERKGKKGKKES